MNSDFAYFDNAATTFPKPEEVYFFADGFYRNNGVSIGRSSSDLSVAAENIENDAKDNLRQMYTCPTHKVVFTSSATEALNRIILGLGLTGGAEVYITPFEHNAVTRPLSYLAKNGSVNLNVLEFDSQSLLPDYDKIASQFSRQAPKLLVLNHASNVCGVVVPVAEISKMANEYGATVVIDMSQTAGLVPLDLSDGSIDFAVFAGHKTLYSPDGIGGFICKRNSKLNPILFGGNGINSIEQDMPEEIVAMSEIGSRNVYAIAGLYSSTKWILSRGMNCLKAQEDRNRQRLLDILGDYREIKLIGLSPQADYVGVVSAVFRGYSPDECEMLLNKAHVATRSGLHCSPYAHSFLNTLPAGTVRFSVSALTTDGDFRILETALRTLSREMW